MADFALSQAEADTLIKTPKHRADNTVWEYPAPGDGITIPLVSADRREEFALDLWRARINLVKGTYQHRARQVIILVRLDFGGAPHRNPDGEEVASPHLHLYREGYGDKWASPVPGDRFSDLSDAWRTLSDFMGYCNVVKQPIIQRGLFV